MFKQTFLSIMLIGAGAVGFSTAPASAVALPAVQQMAGEQVGNPNLLTQVNHRKRHRFHRSYSYRTHGPRCSARRGNCRHFYGGYYYNRPWWLAAPLIGTTVILSTPRVVFRGGSRHVAWCRAQYRSYSARTNTWIAFSGDVRRCNSPYR